MTLADEPDDFQAALGVSTPLARAAFRHEGRRAIYSVRFPLEAGGLRLLLQIPLMLSQGSTLKLTTQSLLGRPPVACPPAPERAA